MPLKLACLGGFCAAAVLVTALHAGERSETHLVRKIGVDSLYRSTFAVANCPHLAIDGVRFKKAEAAYHLRPGDLGPGGEFANDIETLSAGLKNTLEDDRNAFCSSAALQFAVIKGVLDRQ
jgi:hypothetical protein